MPPSDHDLRPLLDRLFRYALALTHDRSTAEDIVQDACLAVARRGGPWDVAYLMRTVRNKFVDHRRRQDVLRTTPLDPRSPPEVPAVTADAVAQADTIESALATLGPAERELVYLAVFEDHTAAEIADLTGRPRGTILSAIFRAKDKLRKTLTAGRGVMR